MRICGWTPTHFLPTFAYPRPQWVMHTLRFLRMGSYHGNAQAEVLFAPSRVEVDSTVARDVPGLSGKRGRTGGAAYPLPVSSNTMLAYGISRGDGREVWQRGGGARGGCVVSRGSMRLGKTVQQFVTGCMVVGGRHPGAGVSELGAHVLCIMGWSDWKGLEEFGPEHIREWLQEMDTVEDLRYSRLLKLF
ncbi:hypothetical protein B0J13DRAFT_567917 [Dactylonectria estremocensis]|uniref:Uncharacterized protein n=1 Tax=Dactylonectria estremocensis TaxID=1079267 RepID=A0A9P9DJ47_9HYPO|nr:hypothetical protein B0J13DRAFT_567917 [Dactylonectria estremocensis]